MKTESSSGLMLALSCILLVTASLVTLPAQAWSNGGYSSDPKNPDYGTHDWLAHHALDWIPDEMDFWIRNNLATYLYGTELPDNKNAALGDGIGDTTLHHVYYRATGQLQDDSSARRAREAYQQALSHLVAGDDRNAAKWLGIATHYIADVAVFGHVMGAATDWGAEKQHSDYEDWVNARTNRYDAEFNIYLKFDGTLEERTIYDATLTLAFDTTFDSSKKGRTAKWMDTNYDPNNPFFRERVGESLNLATNFISDIIHNISEAAGIPEFSSPSLVVPFALAVAVVLIIGFRRTKALGWLSFQVSSAKATAQHTSLQHLCTRILSLPCDIHRIRVG